MIRKVNISDAENIVTIWGNSNFLYKFVAQYKTAFVVKY